MPANILSRLRTQTGDTKLFSGIKDDAKCLRIIKISFQLKMFALNQVLLPLVLVSTIVFGLPLIENNIFGSHGVDMPNMAIRFPIKSENDRIYGGEEAAIGQFPYQISLQVRPSEDNYVHFCGGAIISSRYILTAAHCFIANFPDLRDYRVVVGAHDAHDGNDGKAHGIGRFIFHQDYTNNITEINGTIINDIALIETDSPIQFNNLVAPIALHPKFFENGTRAVASGWGQTDVRIDNLICARHKLME